jgi:uncharacterized protein (DUF885 family)
MSMLHRYLVIISFAGLLLFSCDSGHRNSSKMLTALTERYQTIRDSINEAYKSGWGTATISEYESLESVWNTLLSDLQNLDVKKLTSDEQINLELLDLELSNELNDLSFKSYLMPFNSEGGFLTEIIYMTQGADLDTEEQREQFLTKLKNLPDFLESKKTFMLEGIRTGKVSPAIITSRCLSMIENYVQSSEDDFFLMATLRDADVQDSFRMAVKATVSENVIPAYKELLGFVKEQYLPASASAPGISALEGGKTFYDAKVRYYTTLDMTPDEVFLTGEAEVQRIRGEMEEIISSLDFKGSFDDFLEFLRTDPQFYAKTPRELLYRASWLSKKIEGKLPKYFNKLPRMPFVVEPVPDAIAPNYTGGRYSEGSYKTGKPGAYWVNTFKLESRPLYVLPALTLHEAVPGHHLQIMLSRELENVPEFREQLYISAFGEGWGLYSEYLGKEAGMYETPYEDFGRLTYEMWRACRLVVDVGIHYKGWSREQAVGYMASNTALSLHEVNTEIDRYIGWPAQALSYKIGELKIKALRKKAEDALVEKFDIKTFHDLLLSKGSVKLSTLERMVDDYIAYQKSVKS